MDRSKDSNMQEERVLTLEKKNNELIDTVKELEQHVALLRKEAAQLRAEIDRKENISMTSTSIDVNNMPQKKGYHLVILKNDLPVTIDPRETVASACFSKRTCNILWKLNSRPIPSACLILVYIVGAICSILSGLGLSPYVGYLGIYSFHSYSLVVCIIT